MGVRGVRGTVWGQDVRRGGWDVVHWGLLWAGGVVGGLEGRGSEGGVPPLLDLLPGVGEKLSLRLVGLRGHVYPSGGGTDWEGGKGVRPAL